MTIADALLLVAAGAAAGVLSTVAGLASLVSYPVLLGLGLSPLAANVTNTVSLVLTGAGSAAASRPELTGQGGWSGRVARLGLLTAVGGGAGAAVLLLAPASTFHRAVPVLIGSASLLFLAQPKIRALNARPGAERSAGLHLALLAVGVYVGYFGAAAGVLLLAVLGVMIGESLARLNALKNVINGLANGVASVAFAVFAPVHWVFVPPLAAGFLIGGWTGPKVVRRMPGPALRAVVALAGIGLAVRLGLTAYR
jgi:uncharacterized membrane protein YfcA